MCYTAGPDWLFILNIAVRQIHYYLSQQQPIPTVYFSHWHSRPQWHPSWTPVTPLSGPHSPPPVSYVSSKVCSSFKLLILNDVSQLYLWALRDVLFNACVVFLYGTAAAHQTPGLQPYPSRYTLSILCWSHQVSLINKRSPLPGGWEQHLPFPRKINDSQTVWGLTRVGKYH